MRSRNILHATLNTMFWIWTQFRNYPIPLFSAHFSHQLKMKIKIVQKLKLFIRNVRTNQSVHFIIILKYSCNHFQSAVRLNRVTMMHSFIICSVMLAGERAKSKVGRVRRDNHRAQLFSSTSNSPAAKFENCRL